MKQTILTIIAVLLLGLIAVGYGVTAYGDFKTTRTNRWTIVDDQGQQIGTSTFDRFDTAYNAMQAWAKANPGKEGAIVGPKFRGVYEPDGLDLGIVGMSEAGGVFIFTNVDLVVSSIEPTSIYYGTALMSRTIAPSSDDRLSVVLHFDTTDPVTFKVWDRAEDASNPQRTIYEFTAKPTAAGARP